MKPRQPFDKNKVTIQPSTFSLSTGASPQNAEWLTVYWPYTEGFVNLKIGGCNFS